MEKLQENKDFECLGRQAAFGDGRRRWPAGGRGACGGAGAYDEVGAHGARDSAVPCPALEHLLRTTEALEPTALPPGSQGNIQRSCSKKQSSATLTTVALDSVLPSTGPGYARVRTITYTYIYIYLYIQFF